MHYGVLGVPGEKQNPGLGTARQNVVRQLPAAHVGHHHVGEQHIDVAGMRPADLQGFRPARGRQNGVAELPQNPHREVADRLFVLHHQNGFAAALPGCRGVPSGRFRQRFGNAREIQLEGGPLPRFAINPDVSAGLFDDAVNRGQP